MSGELRELSPRSRQAGRRASGRRTVLRLSLLKLHLIEDPESRLRRSVLINNTFRRLHRQQREQREREARVAGRGTGQHQHHLADWNEISKAEQRRDLQNLFVERRAIRCLC